MAPGQLAAAIGGGFDQHHRNVIPGRHHQFRFGFHPEGIAMGRVPPEDGFVDAAHAVQGAMPDGADPAFAGIAMLHGDGAHQRHPAGDGMMVGNGSEKRGRRCAEPGPKFELQWRLCVAHDAE